MGRSRGFTATLVQMQREAERQQRQQQQAARRAAAEAERTRQAYRRAAMADEKERKRLYLESRVAEVARLNDELLVDVSRLTSLLTESLQVDDFLDLESLKEVGQVPPWNPGDLAIPRKPPAPEAFQPTAPAGLMKLMPVQSSDSLSNGSTEDRLMSRRSLSMSRPSSCVNVVVGRLGTYISSKLRRWSSVSRSNTRKLKPLKTLFGRVVLVLSRTTSPWYWRRVAIPRAFHRISDWPIFLNP